MPKTWYGMPAYLQGRQGRCFSQAGRIRLKVRDIRFSDTAISPKAHVAGAFALMKLTAAEEARIVALVKKAVAKNLSEA